MSSVEAFLCELCAKLRAHCVKGFAIAIAFLVVIPAGDLLLQPPKVHAQTDVYRQTIIPGALYLQPNLPVDAHTYSMEPITKDIRIERVSFATQYGMRIPAIVYTSTHVTSRAPGILIVAGHGGDKTSWYEVYAGLLYASAGAVVVTYDPIGEDERNADRASETRAHDAPIPGLRHPERLGGLMIQDVLQAERYLRQRPDVDPSRTAILAYSMGTFHAAIASALAGPHALILSGGGNLDGPGEYWETGNKINCQVAPWKALHREMGPTAGLLLYQHLGQSTSTLIMNGEVDGLITKFNEEQPWFDRLRAQINAPPHNNLRVPDILFYPGIGHRPSWVNRDAALWLSHQLHFPLWTDQQIKSFPTVTAHDWTQRTGVRIATQYDTPTSEGGVEALDLHLPGLTRDQLQTVPDTIWQPDREKFILESWITKALAEEKSSTTKQ